jgi:hypothetical protein
MKMCASTHGSRKAFYEAPSKLIGCEVWVRSDSRCVKIFNERMETISR